MRKKMKSDNNIDKELEKARFEDFDLDNTVLVNEKWKLTKSYPLNKERGLVRVLLISSSTSSVTLYSRNFL